MGLVRGKREAEALARAEEEEREYRKHIDYWAAKGWKPMHREPPILPMWQCLECSCLAFDRNQHEQWHANL